MHVFLPSLTNRRDRNLIIRGREKANVEICQFRQISSAIFLDTQLKNMLGAWIVRNSRSRRGMYLNVTFVLASD